MNKSEKKTIQSPSAKVESAPVQTLEKAPQDNLDANAQSQQWPFGHGNFAPLHSLRKEVDEIFNQFTSRFGTLSRQPSEDFQMPALDVNETETSFEIAAELPGMKEQDIDVSVTDSVLTIHGEKQQREQHQNTDYRISECSYGVFERSLALPFNCDAESIDAQYDNGVLHMSIPKPKQVSSKAQKVTIKPAA